MLDRVSTQSVKKSSRYGMSSSVILLSLVAGVVATHGGLGCGGSLGAQCTLQSHCDEDLACSYGYCQQECAVTRDCENKGDMCFSDKENSDVKGYCAEPTSCVSDDECNVPTDKGQSCREGICRDGCGSEQPCPNHQECFSNVCYERCKDDKNCLDGEHCFEGKCAARKPIVVTGQIPMPCFIHSDCESLNCIDGHCQGCLMDIDCDGQRLCINPAKENRDEGICGGAADNYPEAKLSSPIREIYPGGDYVLDAAPDSNGENIYFIVEKPSFDPSQPHYGVVFKASQEDTSSPVNFCTLPNGEYHNIIVSNKTLYISGVMFPSQPDSPTQYGLFRTSIGLQSCGPVFMVEETKDLHITALDVNIAPEKNDEIYISAASMDGAPNRIFSLDSAGSISLIDEKGFGGWGDWWNGWWNNGGWGGNLAAGANQLFSITMQWPWPLPSIFARQEKDKDPEFVPFLLEPLVEPMGGLALDVAGETLYLPSYDHYDNSAVLVAVNASNGSPVAQYRLDKPGGSNRRLRRARNKNIFALTSNDSKVYRFEL